MQVHGRERLSERRLFQAVNDVLNPVPDSYRGVKLFKWQTSGRIWWQWRAKGLNASTPVSDSASRRALRSSARGELLVPGARSALKQRRAFSVIGPSTWNELPLTLRLLPQNNMSSFCKLLKTFLFDRSWPE